MTSPNGSDGNRNWQAIIDFIATWSSGAWMLFVDGEYFGASTGTEPGTQFTITGTVRYSPVEYLIISLEPRAEFADNDIYFSRPFVADPVTGETMPSLNKDWFFGFWIGVTARLGN